MGAIDEFASDLNGILADVEAQFKALNDRKARVKERGNDLAQRWSEFFTSQDQALTAAESALNRVSNVPLSAAPLPLQKDAPLSAVPKIA